MMPEAYPGYAADVYRNACLWAAVWIGACGWCISYLAMVSSGLLATAIISSLYLTDSKTGWWSWWNKENGEWRSPPYAAALCSRHVWSASSTISRAIGCMVFWSARHRYYGLQQSRTWLGTMTGRRTGEYHVPCISLYTRKYMLYAVIFVKTPSQVRISQLCWWECCFISAVADLQPGNFTQKGGW